MLTRPLSFPSMASIPTLIFYRRKKKFTLPWWTVLIGWLLVIACIAASCFFLLMYGIMFGDSKATKWITALVISFFTDILFVEPIKVTLDIDMHELNEWLLKQRVKKR